MIIKFSPKKLVYPYYARGMEYGYVELWNEVTKKWLYWPRIDESIEPEFWVEWTGSAPKDAMGDFPFPIKQD